MKIFQANIEPFKHPLLIEHNISLHIKRDDALHGVVSGNKLYKLALNLEHFKHHNKKTLITFGGAYSNHLHATAFMGKELGIQTVGIIRGEQLLPLNPTLKDCTNWGMTLEPVSRKIYKEKESSGEIQAIIKKYEDPYVIPEGGANLLGIKGCETILEGVNQAEYDVIVLACGTGTTLAGLISASLPHIQLIGMAVLKGARWMQQEVNSYLNLLSCTKSNWQINQNYHFSGYGKVNAELERFVKQMEENYQLELEPIYTGKAFYGLLDLIKAGKIEKNTRVLFIHTGGLQGKRGLAFLNKAI